MTATVRPDYWLLPCADEDHPLKVRKRDRRKVAVCPRCHYLVVLWPRPEQDGQGEVVWEWRVLYNIVSTSDPYRQARQFFKHSSEEQRDRTE